MTPVHTAHGPSLSPWGRPSYFTPRSPRIYFRYTCQRVMSILSEDPTVYISPRDILIFSISVCLYIYIVFFIVFYLVNDNQVIKLFCFLVIVKWYLSYFLLLRFSYCCNGVLFIIFIYTENEAEKVFHRLNFGCLIEKKTCAVYLHVKITYFI